MKKQIERGDFMNCSDFQELISAKLDKELTQEEEKLLTEHLKTCINCAGFAKELEELKVTTSSWKNEQIPMELEKKILKRTIKTSRKEKGLGS
jgi:predicted anti-sigma-YlaC factor YlaD